VGSENAVGATVSTDNNKWTTKNVLHCVKRLVRSYMSSHGDIRMNRILFHSMSLQSRERFGSVRFGSVRFGLVWFDRLASLLVRVVVFCKS